jgi:hypothetical protein
LGKEEAERLLQAGWRQGSICRPSGTLSHPSGQPEGSFLIVLTQSCTVVSPNWTANPLVEVAVAVPYSQKFNPKAPEATGKNLRKLVVPVEGQGFDALEIDVNSRFFVSRETLLDQVPDGPTSPVDLGRRIGGWMGRQYSRAALPNELVVRLHRDVLKKLEKLLRKGANPLHEEVVGIFVGWEPDDEEGPYTIKFLIVCSDEDSVQAIFTGISGGMREQDGYLVYEEEGLTVTFDVRSLEATMLSDVDGLARFSEWDFLTDLGEELVQGR